MSDVALAIFGALKEGEPARRVAILERNRDRFLAMIEKAVAQWAVVPKFKVGDLVVPNQDYVDIPIGATKPMYDPKFAEIQKGKHWEITEVIRTRPPQTPYYHVRGGRGGKQVHLHASEEYFVLAPQASQRASAPPHPPEPTMGKDTGRVYKAAPAQDLLLNLAIIDPSYRGPGRGYWVNLLEGRVWKILKRGSDKLRLRVFRGRIGPDLDDVPLSTVRLLTEKDLDVLVQQGAGDPKAAREAYRQWLRQGKHFETDATMDKSGSSYNFNAKFPLLSGEDQELIWRQETHALWRKAKVIGGPLTPEEEAAEEYSDQEHEEGLAIDSALSRKGK